MAYFYRLVIILFFASSAHALVPYGYQQSPNVASISAARVNVCNSWGAPYSPCSAGANTHVINSVPSTVCGSQSQYFTCIITKGKDGGVADYITERDVLGCPSNSTQVDSNSCACNSGFAESGDHLTCVPPPQCLPTQVLDPPTNTCIPKVCPAGKKLNQTTGVCEVPPKCDWAKDQTQFIFGSFFIERGKPLCSSGCLFILKPDATVAASSKRLGPNSPWFDEWTMGHFVGTGIECSGEQGADTGNPVPSPFPPGEDGKPPADKCPQGKVGGTVNGVFTCVTAGESVDRDNKQTNTTTGAGTGTESKAKTTTCTGNTCTTTEVTTGTNPDGSPKPATTTTTTGSKDGTCKDDPTLEACEDPDSFVGTCQALPKCDGDPIICEVAKQTFITRCALQPDASPESDLYTASKGKTGNVLLDLPNENKSTFSISASSFNSSNILGGSGGAQDLNVVVMGRSITLPFSTVNIWLERLGMLLQAVTFLLCLKIVTRESI